MTNKPDEQNIVVVFSEDKELQKKVQETFPDFKIIISNVMLSTFETFKNHFVKAVVFETYQTDPFCGINETDLDILMYYACSDDSKHKATAFIPIDKRPTEGQELNFANDFYGRLYDKYLYLKPGTFFDEIDPESIEMPAGMELLGNLVDVLSGATKDLDEKVTITGGDSQVGEESQRISGTPENIDEEVQVVSGSSEKADDELTALANLEGALEEPEQSFDQETNDNEVQTISGNTEEEEEVQTISGSTDEDEEVQTIGGSTNEDEEVQTIGGSTDEDEGSTTVSGAFDEEDDEEFVVSGDSEDLADKTVQTIKGEKEDLAEDDFMKVKSLKPQEEEEEVQSSDINGRNSKGQTPVMVFARKGDTQKVLSFLNSGAKHDLLCKQGLSLLHYACWGSDDVEFIDELILKYNLKHSKRDSENRDCLYYAVIGNNANVVEYLLNNGARIGTKYAGIPLLHVAAKVNASNSFKSLLLFEPNLKATDDFGEDIIKYCKTKKKLGFLKIIAAVSKLKQKAAS